MRASNRQNNELRNITIEPNILKNAEGSCLIKCGNTHVICSATVDSTVPRFLRGSYHGWITAEYAMLPRATSERVKRESVIGKQSGRTQEIQRLIGRALRATVDLKALGERQILIDCDVINADGGTRTTAITGAYIALHLAIRKLITDKTLKTNPLTQQVAAISCGIHNGNAIVDLDYFEDSNATVDANFVFAGNGNVIEIQATAEKAAFSDQELIAMLALAKQSAVKLFNIQNTLLLDIL